MKSAKRECISPGIDGIFVVFSQQEITEGLVIDMVGAIRFAPCQVGVENRLAWCWYPIRSVRWPPTICAKVRPSPRPTVTMPSTGA